MAKEKLFSVTIHDCEVQTFRSGGKGGQNQNKRDSGVRIIHRPSGAIGESREERSQLQNKTKAFGKMARDPKMTYWLKMTTSKLMGKETLEERVDRLMEPSNLVVEGWSQDGQWQTI